MMLLIGRHTNRHNKALLSDCFSAALQNSRKARRYASQEMTPEEIKELLEEHKTYNLPDTIIERELMLGLVASDDPMFLLQVPEPFRSNIISFGLKVTNQWLEISSNGTVDYSEHAEKLRHLVGRFLAEVPIGKHINWRSPNA